MGTRPGDDSRRGGIEITTALSTLFTYKPAWRLVNQAFAVCTGFYRVSLLHLQCA